MAKRQPAILSSTASRAGRIVASTWLLSTLSLPISSAALAQSDKVAAEALFDEGRRLMDEGRYAEACPKLAESHRLDPGGGTLLNLALCHEKQGKTATAWGEFKEALGMGRTDERADRIEFAEQHIAALEPQLSYLTIEVPRDHAVPGLVIAIDGAELGAATWNLALPTDPGQRHLRAEATGHRPWEGTVVVAAAERKRVTVPRLEALPNTAAAFAPNGSQATTTPPSPEPDRADSAGPNVQRIIGYSIGGLGIASAVVGVVFGVRALDKDGEADDVCGEQLCPPTPEGEAAQAKSDEARRSATMANAFLGIGGGLVAIGLVVVLTATDEPEQVSMLAPWLGPGGGGAAWRATW